MMKRFKRTIALTAVFSVLSQAGVFAAPISFNNWFSISAPSVGEAYVSSQYVTVVSPDDESVEFVNIRQEADVESDAIGMAKVGQCLSVQAVENDWYKVIYNDTVGYIYKDYVTGSVVDAENARAEEEAKKKAEEEEAKAEEEARLKAEEEAKKKAEEEAEAQEPLMAQQEIYASINAYDGLNLRKEPSMDSAVITAFDYGYCVDVISVEGEWIEVDDNGTSGYLKAEYVDLHNGQKPEEAENPQNLYVENPMGQAVVDYAKKFIGTPYVYGGTNLNSGVDCSGFTYSVYKKFGINLNRVSRDQIKNGRSVAKSDLQPGDLVFFNTGGNSSISHVGMYIGNGQYIHSTDGKAMGVTISSLSSSYSLRTYYGACRVLS